VKRYLAFSVLLLAAALGACGYNFRGRQNNLPSDVRTIAIPMFKNNTGELRIESTFTGEVIFQFTRSQMVRVVSEDQADAILRGEIMAVEIEDVAYSATETSRQRRVKITVKADLTRRRDGQVLWQDRRLIQRRTYLVSSDAMTTDTAKATAITELAKAMAQTLHDRVFENF